MQARKPAGRQPRVHAAQSIFFIDLLLGWCGIVVLEGFWLLVVRRRVFGEVGRELGVLARALH